MVRPQVDVQSVLLGLRLAYTDKCQARVAAAVWSDGDLLAAVEHDDIAEYLAPELGKTVGIVAVDDGAEPGDSHSVILT